MMFAQPGKVAVITGAASGIGLALARRAADGGMRLVLADVEAPTLATAAAGLQAGGTDVLPVVTDVARETDVAALADAAFERFGAVHLLCNNAGVFTPRTPLWEQQAVDWQWVLGVNLWGIIHAIRAFVPRMLLQQEESHIVNTASEASFTIRAGTAAYNTSKHAVLALSESLQVELAQAGAPVKVHALCPAGVSTRILDAERNRPAQLRRPGEPPFDPTRTRPLDGLDPAAVADSVFSAIDASQFYVFPHPEVIDWVRQRMERVTANQWPIERAATPR